MRHVAKGVENMRAIGLFSGVGGIELGFEMAGIKTIWANEIDKNATLTYNLNHNHPLVVGDISDIKSESIPNADVVLAGFPCQAFSIAGYQKGFDDDRGNIFFELARVIRDKKPRIIFIENVRNLISHDKGNTYRVISSTLSKYGYKIYPLVLNSSEYGNIPQNRERIYIIGFHNERDYNKFIPPLPIPLTKTIRDIIDIESKVDDKYYYTEKKHKFFKELEKKVIDNETIYQWRRVYVRENKSQLCPTLTANMGTGGHNVPLILTNHGIRKLTPHECFKFQGFPDKFKLPDIAQSHLYKQAGNSVVVPVITRLAKSIINSLK